MNVSATETPPPDTGEQTPAPALAPPPDGFVVRVAGWSIRHRWLVLVLWLVSVVLVYGVSLGTGVEEQSDADMLSGQAADAERLLDDAEFDAEGAQETVLVQARDGELTEARAAELAAELTRRYASMPDAAVLGVGEPVRAEDGRSMLIQVELDRGTGDERVSSRTAVAPMLATTEELQQAHDDVRIEQVGAGSLQRALSEGAEADFQRAELFSVPVTFLILLVVFGALVAAGVPLLLGLTSVFFALGLSAVTSLVLPANANQPSLILLLGLAVAVDYSLFYMRRAREERETGHDTRQALRVAAATSGHAVVVSGVSVMVAMASMFLAGNGIFSSLALGAIIVVGVAVLASLTVLPATLALLGRGVDRLRVPLLSRRGVSEGSRLWDAVLRPVLRAPVAAVVAGVVLLGALALPVTGMKFAMPSDADLPGDYAAVQTLHRVNEAFPGNRASHTVVVEAPAERAGEVADGLAALYERAGETGDFELIGPADIVASNDRTVTKMSLDIPHEPNSDAARDTLDQVRDELAPGTVGEVEGAAWYVGGEVAFDADFTEAQRDRLPLVIAFVVLLCVLVMMAAFRSLGIALATAALNLLSIAAAYGVMVLVFQHGWAEGLLDFDSTGAIVSWVPLILFVLLFGLSMDYHVFVLSRIREAALGGAEPREAIRYGVVHSAGVVTSAAVIMVAVFSIFATLSTIEMKQLGVGLALAVLIDATVVRGVLLPGALALLGGRVWRRRSGAE